MKYRDKRRLYGTLPAILSIVFFVIAVYTIPAHFPEDQGLATFNVLPTDTNQPMNSTAPDYAPEQIQKVEPLSDRIVEYHIFVKLDEKNKMLNATETVTWRNPGALPVQELYMHLYPNAFRDMQSTFNRESGGKLRNDEMTADSVGFMDISKVQLNDGGDISHTIQYIQPDDGNSDDMTLMKIRLPEPIAPDDTVTMKLTYTVKLPHVYARMGYVDDFVMAGQWFPKLAVYETKGQRDAKKEGWNLHQYHGSSEFYSDFGIYNVQIDVPDTYTVAASGFPVEKAKMKEGRRLYHYYAEDVHDFAWAASPNFIYAEEAYSTENLPGVKIKLYLDPVHEPLKDRYMQAAKRSLARYTEWYGEYPYSTLSIVVPPKGGNGAGGMEYPTLITAWAAEEQSPSSELERVIVHEIGHQFWYGMVASNEFEEAWLDEGFTTYVEDKVMAEEFGILKNLPVLSSYMTAPAPLKLNAWEYNDRDEYAENVYTRSSLVLTDIEQAIGDKKMAQVMKTYFNRWKFDHPTTKDFQQALEDVTHRSWEGYFQQFVYHDLMIDYAVAGVQSKLIQLDGVNHYETTVAIERRSGVFRPVTIAICLADGSIILQSWDGQDEQTLLTVTSEQPAAWALIDPEFKQVLENRHYNNYMKAHVDSEVEVRWTYGIAKILETLLNVIAW